MDILPEHLRHGVRCDACWPPSLDAAWQARSRLVEQHVLIDESHYRVRILACATCSQRFVAVFTERIDWDHGEDPQEWYLAPISAQEEAMLHAEGEGLTESTIEAAAAGRYVLRHEYPSDGEPRTSWSPILLIGPHD